MSFFDIFNPAYWLQWILGVFGFILFLAILYFVSRKFSMRARRILRQYGIRNIPGIKRLYLLVGWDKRPCVEVVFRIHNVKDLALVERGASFYQLRLVCGRSTLVTKQSKFLNWQQVSNPFLIEQGEEEIRVGLYKVRSFMKDERVGELAMVINDLFPLKKDMLIGKDRASSKWYELMQKGGVSGGRVKITCVAVNDFGVGYLDGHQPSDPEILKGAPKGWVFHTEILNKAPDTFNQLDLPLEKAEAVKVLQKVLAGTVVINAMESPSMHETASLSIERVPHQDPDTGKEVKKFTLRITSKADPEKLLSSILIQDIASVSCSERLNEGNYFTISYVNRNSKNRDCVEASFRTVDLPCQMYSAGIKLINHNLNLLKQEISSTEFSKKAMTLTREERWEKIAKRYKTNNVDEKRLAEYKSRFFNRTSEQTQDV